MLCGNRLYLSCGPTHRRTLLTTPPRRHPGLELYKDDLVMWMYTISFYLLVRINHFTSFFIVWLESAGHAVCRVISCNSGADVRFIVSSVQCTILLLTIAKKLHPHDVGTINIYRSTSRSQGTVIFLTEPRRSVIESASSIACSIVCLETWRRAPPSVTVWLFATCPSGNPPYTKFLIQKKYSKGLPHVSIIDLRGSNGYV